MDICFGSFVTANGNHINPARMEDTGVVIEVFTEGFRVAWFSDRSVQWAYGSELILLEDGAN